MKYKFIRLSTEGPVATLLIDRPEIANALSFDTLKEIEHAVLTIRESADIRVVIMVGKGKHFSSGADLTESERTSVPLVMRRREIRLGERVVEAILNLDQITIAAWRGAAIGGGACLAVACDFRVGGDDCFMRCPEVDMGVSFAWRSLPLFVNLLGPPKAKRLIIGGEKITSETLLAWGVLDERVAVESTVKAAKKMALHYASKSPVVAQMIKQSINHCANTLNRALMHMDADQCLLAERTEDRQTAITAYMDKCTPEFKGN